MGINERKEREKLEMRRLILDAAMKLFVDEGYDHVTIRKIADSIEYSPATIYLYFDDKVDILIELSSEGFQNLKKCLSAVYQIADPYQRLLTGLELYIDFGLDNPEYYDLMFIMYSTKFDPGYALKHKKDTPLEGEKAFNVLRDSVKYCQDKGILKTGDVDLLSFGFWSFVHGMVSLSLRERIFFIPSNMQRMVMKSAIQNVVVTYLKK